MFRLIQISDTHLSPDEPRSGPGWEAALQYIRDIQPDLVVHSGDIIAGDADTDGDHVHAAAELRRILPPLLSIPGNHDVGDVPPSKVLTSEFLLRQFEERYGASRWVRDIPQWRLIGLNSLLLGSGLANEDCEWSHFQAALDAAHGNVAVFMHKPPFVLCPNEADQQTAAIPYRARDRFWRMARSGRVCLIASGHRHEYRMTHCDGVPIVWCPATAPIPESTPPLKGSPDPALIEYVFDGDTVAHTYVRLEVGRVA